MAGVIETETNVITAGRRTPGSVTPATNLLRDPGDEDKADGLRRLCQSRSRRVERSTRKASSGRDSGCFVSETQPFHTALSTAAVADLPSS
ncbi:unnamed protein product [Ascophyllum nodosum]